VSELRAAPFVLRHVGGTLAPAAPFLLGAGQTGVTMPGHDGKKIFLSFGANGFVVRDDDHPLLDFRVTGSRKFLLPLNLHHAETAALAALLRLGVLNSPIPLKDDFRCVTSFGRRQVRMRAKSRDVYSGAARCRQNRGSRRNFNLPTVNRQLHHTHDT
jgi:hypothetical protein